MLESIKNRKETRLLHLFLSFLMIAQSLPAAPAAQAAVPAAENFPDDPALIQLPDAAGKIEESFKGKKDRLVILVQDAHAIPDAQRSIQKIIGHFQEQHGLKLVASEGSVGAFDTRIFRSFPDKELLKQAFEDYFQKGELTGSMAAAVFHDAPTAFFGVEDWPVYEEGLGYFLTAMQQQEKFSEILSALKSELDARKQSAYSKELFELDRMLSEFHANKRDLLSILKELARVRAPETGSELALLLDETRQAAPGGGDAFEEELKRVARQAEDALRMRQSTPEGRKAVQEFNRQRQDFNVSSVTPEAFALFLKEFAVREKIELKFSDAFTAKAADQRRMRDIEGTRFFKDFEAYAAEVKNSLLRNDAERGLDAETRRLETMERLVRLEVGFDEWNAIRSWPADQGSGLDFTAHFNFYRNAEKRDQIFAERMEPLFKEQKARAALLVAGGFHAEGLTHTFRERGVSFIRIMPRIQRIPAESTYREHMRGNVSWKDFFEVEDGKVSPYKAFVRGTREKLLKMFSGGVPAMLREWRDQILRDLALDQKAGEAGRYTAFLDERAEGGEAELPRFARIEKFILDLKQLEADGQLNRQNVLKLLAPASTMSDLGTYAVAARDVQVQPQLVLGDTYRLAASEVRVNPPVNDPRWQPYYNEALGIPPGWGTSSMYNDDTTQAEKNEAWVDAANRIAREDGVGPIYTIRNGEIEEIDMSRSEVRIDPRSLANKLQRVQQMYVDTQGNDLVSVRTSVESIIKGLNFDQVLDVRASYLENEWGGQGIDIVLAALNVALKRFPPRTGDRGFSPSSYANELSVVQWASADELFRESQAQSSVNSVLAGLSYDQALEVRAAFVGADKIGEWTTSEDWWLPKPANPLNVFEGDGNRNAVLAALDQFLFQLAQKGARSEVRLNAQEMQRLNAAVSLANSSENTPQLGNLSVAGRQRKADGVVSPAQVWQEAHADEPLHPVFSYELGQSLQEVSRNAAIFADMLRLTESGGLTANERYQQAIRNGRDYLGAAKGVLYWNGEEDYRNISAGVTNVDQITAVMDAYYQIAQNLAVADGPRDAEGLKPVRADASRQTLELAAEFLELLIRFGENRVPQSLRDNSRSGLDYIFSKTNRSAVLSRAKGYLRKIAAASRSEVRNLDQESLGELTPEFNMNRALLQSQVDALNEIAEQGRGPYYEVVSDPGLNGQLTIRQVDMFRSEVRAVEQKFEEIKAAERGVNVNQSGAVRKLGEKLKELVEPFGRDGHYALYAYAQFRRWELDNQGYVLRWLYEALPDSGEETALDQVFSDLIEVVERKKFINGNFSDMHKLLTDKNLGSEQLLSLYGRASVNQGRFEKPGYVFGVLSAALEEQTAKSEVRTAFTQQIRKDILSDLENYYGTGRVEISPATIGEESPQEIILAATVPVSGARVSSVEAENNLTMMASMLSQAFDYQIDFAYGMPIAKFDYAGLPPGSVKVSVRLQRRSEVRQKVDEVFRQLQELERLADVKESERKIGELVETLDVEILRGLIGKIDENPSAVRYWYFLRRTTEETLIGKKEELIDQLPLGIDSAQAREIVARLKALADDGSRPWEERRAEIYSTVQSYNGRELRELHKAFRETTRDIGDITGRYYSIDRILYDNIRSEVRVTVEQTADWIQMLYLRAQQIAKAWKDAEPQVTPADPAALVDKPAVAFEKHPLFAETLIRFNPADETAVNELEILAQTLNSILVKYDVIIGSNGTRSNREDVTALIGALGTTAEFLRQPDNQALGQEARRRMLEITGHDNLQDYLQAGLNDLLGGRDVTEIFLPAPSFSLEREFRRQMAEITGLEEKIRPFFQNLKSQQPKFYEIFLDKSKIALDELLRALRQDFPDQESIGINEIADWLDRNPERMTGLPLPAQMALGGILAYQTFRRNYLDLDAERDADGLLPLRTVTPEGQPVDIVVLRNAALAVGIALLNMRTAESLQADGLTLNLGLGETSLIQRAEAYQRRIGQAIETAAAQGPRSEVRALTKKISTAALSRIDEGIAQGIRVLQEQKDLAGLDASLSPFSKRNQVTAEFEVPGQPLRSIQFRFVRDRKAKTYELEVYTYSERSGKGYDAGFLESVPDQNAAFVVPLVNALLSRMRSRKELKKVFGLGEADPEAQRALAVVQLAKLPRPVGTAFSRLMSETDLKGLEVESRAAGEAGILSFSNPDQPAYSIQVTVRKLQRRDDYEIEIYAYDAGRWPYASFKGNLREYGDDATLADVLLRGLDEIRANSKARRLLGLSMPRDSKSEVRTGQNAVLDIAAHLLLGAEIDAEAAAEAVVEAGVPAIAAQLPQAAPQVLTDQARGWTDVITSINQTVVIEHSLTDGEAAGIADPVAAVTELLDTARTAVNFNSNIIARIRISTALLNRVRGSVKGLAWNQADSARLMEDGEGGLVVVAQAQMDKINEAPTVSITQQPLSIQDGSALATDQYQEDGTPVNYAVENGSSMPANFFIAGLHLAAAQLSQKTVDGLVQYDQQRFRMENADFLMAMNILRKMMAHILTARAA